MVSLATELGKVTGLTTNSSEAAVLPKYLKSLEGFRSLYQIISQECQTEQDCKDLPIGF